MAEAIFLYSQVPNQNMSMVPKSKAEAVCKGVSDTPTKVVSTNGRGPYDQISLFENKNGQKAILMETTDPQMPFRQTCNFAGNGQVGAIIENSEKDLGAFEKCNITKWVVRESNELKNNVDNIKY
jgi:hypothetical protein